MDPQKIEQLQIVKMTSKISKNILMLKNVHPTDYIIVIKKSI